MLRPYASFIEENIVDHSGEGEEDTRLALVSFIEALVCNGPVFTIGKPHVARSSNIKISSLSRCSTYKQRGTGQWVETELA
jgi:hypothetical protein